jgi:hypothetical protein
MSAGGLDIVVAKYDASGAHLWSQRFGGTGSEQGSSVAVDASGNVVVTGFFNDTVNFGGGNLVSTGSNDIFVAKFDASGAHLWSNGYGDDGDALGALGFGVAVDAADNVIVTGEMQGTVDFGGGLLVGPGFTDIFLAKYDANGTHVWSKVFGGPTGDQGRGVAVDAADNVIMAGRYSGNFVDFGGGPLSNAGTTVNFDVFVVKFDPSGVHLWSQGFGSPALEGPRGVAVGPSGNVVLTGRFRGAVDFGGGPLVNAGNNDIFIVELDTNGLHQFSLGVGSTGSDVGLGITVDAAGNVYATGVFRETVDFGGGPLVSAGGRDGYLVKFAPPFVSVSGTVSSDCDDPMNGVTVDLDHPNGDMLTTSTDPTGYYEFTEVPQSAGTAVVSIVIPLGYAAITPALGQALITLDQVQVVDFDLACLDPQGEARSMGYWKHQANVYLKNKGNAQETQADMETNYPAEVFNHFHENELNSIAVEGVTYVDSAGVVPVDLDLATLHATLSVKGNAGMEAKAKQQYLALLLNLASGKLLTSSIVSDDGATASQAVQQVAAYINDMDSSNDEIAKDICDTINNAQLVAAGVINVGLYDHIAYSRSVRPEFWVSPNPGRHGRHMFGFTLPSRATVNIVVYNLAGRRVAAPFAGMMEAGSHRVPWNGRSEQGARLGSGIYFAKMVTPMGTRTLKLLRID